MTELTRGQRRAFVAVVTEFDLPFSIPEAQQIARRIGVGDSVTKRMMQVLMADGDLETVGMDGQRKLWWWTGEPRHGDTAA